MARRRRNPAQLEAFTHSEALSQPVKRGQDEWSDVKVKLRDFTEEALSVALRIGNEWSLRFDEHGRWTATHRDGLVVRASSAEALVRMVEDPLLRRPSESQLELFATEG